MGPSTVGWEEAGNREHDTGTPISPVGSPLPSIRDWGNWKRTSICTATDYQEKSGCGQVYTGMPIIRGKKKTSPGAKVISAPLLKLVNWGNSRTGANAPCTDTKSGFPQTGKRNDVESRGRLEGGPERKETGPLRGCGENDRDIPDDGG